MKIVQIRHSRGVRAAVVESRDQLRLVDFDGGTYALAQAAIAAGVPLAELIGRHRSHELLDYKQVIDRQQLLPPITHPDPARCLVSGTGLTHLGSASTRAEMHAQVSAKASEQTDSMRMFQLGLEGASPGPASPAPSPSGSTRAMATSSSRRRHHCRYRHSPRMPAKNPSWSGSTSMPLTAPWRVGFAIGNEFSDHVTERANYLWLAHSKLRACSYGPELLIGDLPAHLEGESRIVRDGEVVWRKPFLTGEENMAHSIANLEHHHFKYPQFRRPGDLHVHYFGTATLSFADGVKTRDGDRFEIELPSLGRALRNPLRFAEAPGSVAVAGVL
ncbi:AraD1 family protein [Marinobacterium aestuariivivens]|uniref:AraD1 family protein n=1 Tax=Marinobacterium aestuariivivens TaxID=1698799 RepID=A0ABW2A5N4_9GAMM